MTSEVGNIAISLYNTVSALVIAIKDALAQEQKMCEVCVKLLTTE